MNSRDTQEEEGFLKAIKENRLDHPTRMIYADWLEDHDRPEEADRQRNWTKHYKLLEDTAHYGDMSMSNLLEFLEKHTTKDYYLGFDTPYGFREYSDEMWESFEVITGLKAPDRDDPDRTEMPSFRCGC